MGDYYGFGASYIEMLTLNGRFVAYVLKEEQRYQDEPTGEELKRLNVQTGARVQMREPCYAAPGGTCGLGSQGRAEVRDVVVTSAGTMAWIADVCRSGAAPHLECSYEVIELPARSTRSVQVAASTTIAPKSLAVAGARLYWTEAGQPRSARIGQKTSRRGG